MRACFTRSTVEETTHKHANKGSQRSHEINVLNFERSLRNNFSLVLEVVGPLLLLAMENLYTVTRFG